MGRVQQWDNARKKLKIAFRQVGITTCEVRLDGNCWRDNGLSFAHSKKRNDIQGDELYEVVLACAYCHTMMEGMDKEAMTKLVRSIIAKRICQPRLDMLDKAC
jgi:hypothetical protein